MNTSETEPVLEETDLSMHESETTLADQSDHPHLLRKTVKSILIVVLSVLCIAGGVLIHRLHTSAKAGYPSFPSANLEERYLPSVMALKGERHDPAAQRPVPSVLRVTDIQPAAVRPVEPEPAVQEAEAQSSQEAKDAETLTGMHSEALADQIRDAFQAVDTDAPAVLQAAALTPNETHPQSETLSPQVQPKMMRKEPALLKDILMLEDAFLHSDSCVDAYEVLAAKAPVDSLSVQRVLINLTPFCARPGNPVVHLTKTFLSDKRQARYAYYQLKESAPVAYLKAFLGSLVDIHKVTPEGNKPRDLIDRAQTALSKGHVAAAMALIDELPVSLKASFAAFLHEAYAYRRAKESLMQLILTFERLGE